MPRRGGDRDNEFFVAEALLRQAGWIGPRGLKQRKINRWLRRLNRDSGPGSYFDLRTMASDCDLILYARNRAGDRREILDPMVSPYVQRMRDAAVTFVRLFWQLPQYQKYVNDGLSDEQIFDKVVRFMVKNDVYPVWSDREDPERKWKLMDLDAYAYLRQMRANAIVNEVADKGTEMEVMMRRFDRYLPGKYTRPTMVRDGSFINPPLIGPGQGVRCPVETCGLHFSDLQSWMRHCLREHPDFYGDGNSGGTDRKNDGAGPPRGLDALFDGSG